MKKKGARRWIKKNLWRLTALGRWNWSRKDKKQIQKCVDVLRGDND